MSTRSSQPAQCVRPPPHRRQAPRFVEVGEKRILGTRCTPSRCKARAPVLSSTRHSAYLSILPRHPLKSPPKTHSSGSAPRRMLAAASWPRTWAFSCSTTEAHTGRRVLPRAAQEDGPRLARASRLTIAPEHLARLKGLPSRMERSVHPGPGARPESVPLAA